MGMDAPRESDTKRDGFLSYAGEVHALTLGLAVGLASVITGTYLIAAAFILTSVGYKTANKLTGGRGVLTDTVVGEIRKEPWYAVGGVLISIGVGEVAQALGLLTASGLF